MTAVLLGDIAVSRETMDRLKALESLLLKWNPAINLVSKASLSQSWDRHILDSAQIFHLAPHVATWADLGSGGGFPGIVVACLAKELNPDLTVTLVESDQRKATFLRQAIRELSLKADVRAERIESTAPLAAAALSARALAPLTDLLGFSQRHLHPDGIALFLKGSSWKDEVAMAQKQWHFNLYAHPSATDPNGAILAVKAIKHV